MRPAPLHDSIEDTRLTARGQPDGKTLRDIAGISACKNRIQGGQITADQQKGFPREMVAGVNTSDKNANQFIDAPAADTYSRITIRMDEVSPRRPSFSIRTGEESHWRLFAGISGDASLAARQPDDVGSISNQAVGHPCQAPTAADLGFGNPGTSSPAPVAPSPTDTPTPTSSHTGRVRCAPATGRRRRRWSSWAGPRCPAIRDCSCATTARTSTATAADFSGGMNAFRSDLKFDGVVNLSDIPVMSAAIGANCP